MKIVALIFMSAVVVGTQALPLGNIDKLASEFFFTGDEFKTYILQPAQNAQVEIVGFYSRLSNHYQKKGLTLNNPAACWDLTSTSKVAYDVGVNTTEFLVSSLSELSSSLISVTNCSSGNFIDEAECFYERAKTVKADLLAFEQNSLPYRHKVSDTWNNLADQMRQCIGF